MANILVVDDDRALRELVAAALERDGHRVTALADGASVTREACAAADCILLDVMMPGEDGFALCRRIRGEADCPILFLTAKTDEADVLLGLGVGADDYLAKPFRVAELRARVSAHLRRERRTPVRKLVRGRLSFDLGAHALSCAGERVALTRGEYAICEWLARSPGQTFSKEQIYEGVFGYDGTADESAITEHVKNIRAKLRRVGEEPIETVWGVGYRWKREDERLG